MAISQLVFTGDSLTQGTGPSSVNPAIAQGGQGCWAELVAERLANIAGLGPLLSSGMRGVWLGLLTGGDEWSFAGTWTAVATTDAWDKTPYGHAKYANGSTNIATYTRPSTYRTVVGFAIYWVDYTNGGNWSYRIDGGSWTAMGQTLANDNQLCKFYVSSSVTSTVEIRAADSSGTGVGCLPVGIELFYSTATQGLIVHNIGTNGERLDNLVKVTSGDRMAFFDSVKLGTGSPISNTPNAGITIMHINDVAIANTTTWANDLTTFYNRVSSLAPVGFINPWECETGTYDQTQQTNYRAQTKTSAASLGAQVYDLYDAWSSNGFTANAGAVAAGYLCSDHIHESQAGHLELATKLYWFVRDQLLGYGAVSNSYPVTANRSATVYSGVKASAVYNSSLPLIL